MHNLGDSLSSISVSNPVRFILTVSSGSDGLLISIHWVTQDERGEDGVVTLPDGGEKKLLIGTRIAATREKRSKVDNKEALEEIQDKAAQKLEVEGQTKARRNSTFVFTLAVTGS